VGKRDRSEASNTLRHRTGRNTPEGVLPAVDTEDTLPWERIARGSGRGRLT
jgi:hypothetical protein